MKIEKNKKYRIKGHCRYFKDKYGTFNPEFIPEGTDREVFGQHWGMMKGNPAAMFFAMRTGLEGIHGSKVYYGKVGILGELVYGNELEEI